MRPHAARMLRRADDRCPHDSQLTALLAELHLVWQPQSLFPQGSGEPEHA
ncbi:MULTISPECIES: hypothetical protein [unclassified Streptomyces]|nr:MULTISPECIES: hypothetical protein [unclassified Streptomyces]MYT29122.1 hypothetical protein [Streptomyces sp. SID8354]